MLLSTHIMTEVNDLCDRVLFLSKGRIMADASPEQLRMRAGEVVYQLQVPTSQKQSVITRLNDELGARTVIRQDDGVEVDVLAFGLSNSNLLDQMGLTYTRRTLSLLILSGFWAVLSEKFICAYALQPDHECSPAGNLVAGLVVDVTSWKCFRYCFLDALILSLTRKTFSCTPTWFGRFYCVVIQCLVSIQGLAGGGRLDTSYIQRAQLSLGCLATLVEFAVLPVSSLVSVFALGFALGFPVVVWQMLGYALAPLFPPSLGCVYLVYGFEVRFNRTFHFINLLLDALVIFSCVLWPLNTFAGITRITAQMSPLTHLNEFIRTSNPSHALLGILVSFIFLLFGVAWVKHSTKKYQVDGAFGGSL